ncbi:MAG: class I SAM-dependent methyltransferase [Rhodobacterales bacterium]
MSDLKRHIMARIAAEGPLSVADYMTECLLHPTLGYYTTRDPFGAAGDFITAPEISQMFGEMVGLCLAQSWLDQGAPSPCVLAELGPGRGTLMADILRATRSLPGFHDAVQVHLVEASPALRARQAATLDGLLPADRITWHDRTESLPELPLLLIANEFFDALPIRQFIRDGAGWSERRIGIKDGKLQFGRSAPSAQDSLAHRLDDTSEGDLVEVCPAAGPIMQVLADRIETHGGAALVVDYGDWRSLGDTWQALRGHAPCDPLDAPGTADLTAHVDFEALLTGLACAHSRVTPQGVFLERLGITARAQALAAKLDGAALDAHIAAHRRLTHPQEMGTLFKVVALFPSAGNPPPGLEI